MESINKHNDEISEEYVTIEDSSNPNPADDTSAEDDKKLKGDAIGNTMYSERYVLKTLLKLMDNEWDEEIESDMCSIWDMTTEKDVVDFLLQNNFIDLSVDIIKETKELRLVEILVGIIGNMCTYPEASIKTIEAHEVLLSLINSSDALTLVQLMRLYKALLFCDSIDHKLLLSDKILEQISFILQSSQNAELLLYTMQVTAEIINKNKADTFKFNILDSIYEAFKEVYKNNNDGFLSRDFEKFVHSYFKVLENMCSVLNDILGNDDCKNIINEVSKSSIERTMSCIDIILNLCADLEFIQNVLELFEYITYCSANFIVSFQTPFHENILFNFVNIFKIILDNNLKFESDVSDSVSNVIMYSVSHTDLANLKIIFKKWPKKELAHIFVNNIINKNECSNEFICVVQDLCKL